MDLLLRQDYAEEKDSPSSSTSSPSPPPPSSDDKSSPPPPSSDESSPPPPSSDKSPPPPSSDKPSSPSPPPPSQDSGSSSSSSPPPPPPKSDSSNNKSPPPPPSTAWHAPPPPPGESPAISSSSSGNSVTVNGKTAVIAGVAVGGGLLLILMIVCVMACCRKKKRNKDHGQMNYFPDTEQAVGAGGNGYYNNYVGKVPPASSQYSSGPWMGASPPPPPPGMSSSEIGSANYSVQPPLPPPHPSLALGFNQSTFSYQDLAAATGGFDKANLLGQGGFGYVHKGILPNGKEVAVKSLKSGSGQGEREFQAEVDIISRVHHRHLVSLVGYCIADSQRMLVYEFVPNNSLEHHLYGKDQPVMDFPTRHKIALGAAKGFAYLHEDCHPRIIHRDIKAANILLDYNYEAKVADFGLAKLSNDTNTHVSTRIMGTFGYLAPEYAASGKLTEKSDVYSYGVVLLELITGKRPIDLRGEDDSLVDWSRPILEQVMEGGSYEELVDPRLGDNYNHEEMLCMVACAAACIRHSARRRPRMSQVVRALEGDANLEDLNEVGRRDRSSRFGSSGSSDFDAYGSRIRRVRPRSSAIMSSNEFTSSEHTSEYAIHASPSSSADSHEIRSNGSQHRTP